MSTEIVTHVATVNFQEETLTEINELSNHLTRAGFTLVLNDENGKVHELGTNTFGMISVQTADEVKALCAGLAETAIGRPVDVTVTTFDAWLKAQ